MSRGESQSLVQLLHAHDNDSELLMKKDEEYAQYIAANNSDEYRRRVVQDDVIEQESVPLSHLGVSAQSERIESHTAFEQMYTSLYDTNVNAVIPSVTPEEAL